MFFVDMLCPRSQNAALRGASDVEATRDLGLADTVAVKLPYLAPLSRRRWRPSQALPVLSCMGQAGANPLAQDLAFELGEYGQQTGHGSPAGRRQIQGLRQRYEPDPEMAEFLKRRHQVRHRSSPAVQSPHQHHIDLATGRGFQQLLPQLPLRCTTPDLFHL